MNADDITSAVSPINEGCAVLHQDAQGNTIPCPDSPAEPLPQPQCSACHGFGAGLVQDALDALKERITTDKAWTSVLVDAQDLSVVLTALEKHHENL